MMTVAERLGARAESMLAALGAISDDEGRLTRLYLSDAHRRAIALVEGWMKQAGFITSIDAAATVHGLRPAACGGPRVGQRLLVGSHIDTVVDAGRYDGTLGVVAGILAAEELSRRGVALPFALEVLAFGDEEGVRFPRTLTSSLAIAGGFDPAALDAADRDGVTLRAALAGFGRDPDRVAAIAYRPQDVIGYIEVHIEQGPVLDKAGEALAVVSAIAAQSRHRVLVTGEAGHAGTVPMGLRRDALAAAAEMVLAVETVALKGADGLVATVGDLVVRPGAINVVPGAVEFSLDIRAASDDVRSDAAAAIAGRLEAIAKRRRVRVETTTVHAEPVAPAAPKLRDTLARAITKVADKSPRTLMSGAGHDAQAMIRLTDIGMIFVRCKNGISHNPLEHAAPSDMGLAVAALVEAIAAIAREKLAGQ
jgi:allantoate deiminase